MTQTAAAQQRIVKLAAQPAVHRAFSWLHLQQPLIRQWQLEMLRIPAPPFEERARAEWFCQQFTQLGLAEPHIDDEGNVLAELGPEGVSRDVGRILISAHLDTVFPAGTLTDPYEDGQRILCPGACDNAAGLSGLLAIAAALKHAGIVPAHPILFAANVGEEGEGDLRGMRHIFQDSAYCGRIASAVILEGGGNSSVVTSALGSRRFRLTVSGPGGHAWADHGLPNPIVLLSKLLVKIADIALPSEPRTTLNIGQVFGGTSVNSIPESVSALLDLRSVSASQLEATAAELQVLISAEPTHDNQRAVVEIIGNRPSAELPSDSPALTSLLAVDRHLGIRTTRHTASTDSNIPLSMGIPALAVGAGGSGGGIHTLHEWYDPGTREIALRRILLLLLDLAS